MRVITSIGEQGLELSDGRQAVLRPSFYAMTQLGTPAEIVEKFVAIHSGPPLAEPMSFDTHGSKIVASSINERIKKRHWRDMLFLSWEILTACSDDDLTPFIGSPGSRYGSYRLGPMPPEAMLVFARALMRHGVIGPMPKKTVEQLEAEAKEPRDRSKFTQEFHAINYVSKAVTHLGISESEAWNMTLTGFAAHWESKYGEPKEQRHSQEHDDTMSWLKKVNELRALKK